ncbi:MAG TPA: ISNCY family transposase [Casimicrobiaceae bacterium]|nr:ISNCY family transposase [Casimicrobiaceae bacterium]
MSILERERSHLVRQTQEKHLSQRQASERLGIGIRQFKRLVQSWKQQGDAGLVSRQRGRASNNRLAPGDRDRIALLLRGKYPDFGPTLAVENLLAREGIEVSAETVRQMQIDMGLWRPKQRRQKRVFQLRERRPRFGELIQIDGSPHAWFEDRGPRCTLIVFIDDATSRLTALRFAPTETTRAYLEALRSHVLAHGCPLAFYSDRHGIFRVNAKDAASGDGKTEFGRVAERLAIEPIHALTPQAKGRVERANQTLQDRLVKEMRLRGIATMAQAEAYLPAFMEAWNRKFAVDPRDASSAHRPWTGSANDLDAVLARREERVLSKALTFRAGGSMYCVKTSGPGTALRGARVTLHHYMDGSMRVHYKDRVLACTAYKKLPVPSEAEDEKTIDARVDRLVAAVAQEYVANMSLATT